MTKLNGHYLFLFLALVLLGPLLPTYQLVDEFHLRPDRDISREIYFLLMVPFLITGTLVWALRLRHSWRAFLTLTPIALLMAGGYGALFRYFSYGEETLFDGPLAVYVTLPTLVLLERGLPPVNPNQKTPPEQPLQEQYRRLLLSLTLQGPLVGSLILSLMVGLINPLLSFLLIQKMQPILELLRGAYRIGFVPALITGALIWALQLRRNWVGVIVTVVLGFIGTGVSAYFLCDNLLAFILIHIAGTLSALFFSFLLPRPEAASPSSNSSPDKNHD